MRERAKCIAVLGTGSDVGKSVVAAALCRIFSDAGVNVAPFKAQNMSNNSFVTRSGGEMGRAQVVQAECARVEPEVSMNPLLLKPGGNCTSQMILHGKVIKEVSSAEFRTDRSAIFGKVMKSLEGLRKNYELVIIEGAGSCAEVNLRDYDIANFRTAIAVNAPVLLVADIDRGGVFAQVTGTLGLLDEAEKNLVKGIFVNRFRGDQALFDDGVKFLREQTGLDAVWVVPHYGAIEIDSEDSLALDSTSTKNVVQKEKINIAVIRLPHISNFTDFSPLMRETLVNLSYLSRPVSLEGIDLLILPGTKNVRSDLQWLKESGWAENIKNYSGKGGNLCGICGGYQMLGREINDQNGVEGRPGRAEGLGLLDITTVMEQNKKLSRVTGRWKEGGARLGGYEIHIGTTTLGPDALPVIELDGGDGIRAEGAVQKGGKVWGTYLHGIFDEGEFREFYISSISGALNFKRGASLSPSAFRQGQYDLLAAHFKKHIDIAQLERIAGFGVSEKTEGVQWAKR